MSKEREFFSLLSELRSNYIQGEATCNYCPTEGCENSAVGRSRCPACCEVAMVDLLKATGMPQHASTLAKRIHQNTSDTQRAVSAALGFLRLTEGKT